MSKNAERRQELVSQIQERLPDHIQDQAAGIVDAAIENRLRGLNPPILPRHWEDIETIALLQARSASSVDAAKGPAPQTPLRERFPQGWPGVQR